MDQQPAQDRNEAIAPEIIPAKPFDDVEENKDIAALGYVWILSIVVFFTRKNSPFVRFHAKQGIVLFILSVAFWMVPMVGRLLELVVLALCALGFINAAQGKRKDLPLIGAFARGDWKAARASWRAMVHGVAEAWRHFRKEKHPAAPASDPAPAPAPEIPVAQKPAEAPATDVPPPQAPPVPPAESL